MKNERKIAISRLKVKRANALADEVRCGESRKRSERLGYTTAEYWLGCETEYKYLAQAYKRAIKALKSSK